MCRICVADIASTVVFTGTNTSSQTIRKSVRTHICKSTSDSDVLAVVTSDLVLHKFATMKLIGAITLRCARFHYSRSTDNSKFLLDTETD